MLREAEETEDKILLTRSKVYSCRSKPEIKAVTGLANNVQEKDRTCLACIFKFVNDTNLG